MAAVAVQAASPAHHYIRTIHTSFTAAHSNPWARSSAHAASSPLLTSNHANMPLYASQPLGSNHVQGSSGPLKYSQPNNVPHRSPSPAGAGGRRRAYAFRAPNVVAAPTPRKGGYKFDPFADEPTTPVPTLSTLASLSVPPQQPATPRLAPASLPPPAPARSSAGLYNHQLHQRRAAAYQQRRGAAALDAATGTTEIWRGFTPIPKARTLAYEIEEYDYDSSSSPLTNGTGGNGGLLTTPLTPSPRPASAPPVSGAAARRSPSPPSTLNPASPPFTPAASRGPAASANAAAAPSRPLSRTPSPPAPAPGPTYANTRSSMLNDKDAKARLVAGILLNRVHVPKPMRRRPMFGDVKRAYVPSGLKNVVACEA